MPAATTSVQSTLPAASASVGLHPTVESRWWLGPRFSSDAIWTLDVLEPDGEPIAVGDEYPGLLVTETSPDGTVLSSHQITTADLQLAAPEFELRRAQSPSGWVLPSPDGNFSWDAVVGRTVVLRTAEHIIGIDAESGRIHSIPRPDVGNDLWSPGPPSASVGVLGDSFVTLVDGTISRIDLQTGAVTEIATVDIADPQVKFGTDAVWVWGGDPSTIVRIDADGSVHRLDQFDGKVIFGELYPGTGLLWVIATDAGVDEQTVLDPDSAHPATVQGLDRDDGHRVVSVPPQPNEAHVLIALHNGLFASTGDGPTLRWRWVGNDGTALELEPRLGLWLLGAVGEQIAYVTVGGNTKPRTIAITDLLAAGNQPATGG